MCLMALSVIPLSVAHSNKNHVVAWQANPVLTTVNTTAHPVKLIEFPAVTICGQGMSDDVISSAMFHQFFDFLEKQNITQNMTAFQAQYLIYVKVMTNYNM
jgi:hypothetical protein